ncbi:MAG: SRPBCC family protein [Alphaproteobacteria bacterium]|nr:SRPBCC family protein [Alphaproteobacteria bacterium]MCY4498483.1 SRPBCC family protein [Rhodospirillaceae bacterium]
MAKVLVSQNLSAPADAVWEAIGKFSTINSWLPPIASCEADGDAVGHMRKLTTVDGAVVYERLDSIDDGARTYSYSITDSPLPLSGYQATISVAEGDGGSSMIHWSSEFDPVGAPEAEVVAVVEGIYQAGFDALKERFGAAESGKN